MYGCILSLYYYENYAETPKGGCMKTKHKENKVGRYVYRLPREDIATMLAVGKGDLSILDVYAGIMGISRIAVIHEMIGTAARCWEENHPHVINKMAKQIEGMKYLLHLYRAKFGPLVEDKEN